MSLTHPIDILQLGPWLGAELRSALAAPFRVRSLYDASDREEMLAQVGPEVRGIICHSGGLPTDRGLIERLPRLEVVVNLGSGTDSIDIACAEERGLTVFDSVGVNAVDVAEHAMALMLGIARDLIGGDQHVRRGGWLRERSPLVHRLGGKAVGILGMGMIGKAIASRAAAFDMKIFYHGRKEQPSLPWTYVPDPVSLARAVDYLVVALPGGAQTHGLVDAAVLDALGPEGYLVNVGRGTVVDEAALIRSIERNGIAGAALDVFADEPNVPRELVASERTVLQAHRGGATHEAYDAIAALTVERLTAHFDRVAVR